MGSDEDIFSPFEHMLKGSTVDQRYHGKMFTPLAVQDGMSVCECNHYRAFRGKQIVLPSKYGVQGTVGVATIPTISDWGEFIEDPRLITTDGVNYYRDNSGDIPWRNGPVVGFRKAGIEHPFLEEKCAPGDKVYLYEDGQVVQGIILGNGSRDGKVILGFRPVKNLTRPDLMLCELGGPVRLEKTVGRETAGLWHLEPAV